MKSDRLKAMLWCRVVLWENSKAGRVVLAVGCCAGQGLWMVWAVVVVDRLKRACG